MLVTGIIIVGILSQEIGGCRIETIPRMQDKKPSKSATVNHLLSPGRSASIPGNVSGFNHSLDPDN